MQLPEVRIAFSHLLYDNASPDFAKSIGEVLPDRNDCIEWTNNYSAEWRKYEQTILNSLTEMLGVEFYNPVLDVSVAPFFIPQSDPLIMNFRNTPDEFVDTLTHELIHVLLTDNSKLQLRADRQPFDLLTTWEEMFGDEHDFNVLVHIPVHAVHKGIFLDTLGDESRLERDIQESHNLIGAEAYVKSWQYVNDHDYHELVAKLRESYQI